MLIIKIKTKSSKQTQRSPDIKLSFLVNCVHYTPDC